MCSGPAPSSFTADDPLQARLRTLLLRMSSAVLPLRRPPVCPGRADPAPRAPRRRSPCENRRSRPYPQVAIVRMFLLRPVVSVWAVVKGRTQCSAEEIPLAVEDGDPPNSGRCIPSVLARSQRSESGSSVPSLRLRLMRATLFANERPRRQKLTTATGGEAATPSPPSPLLGIRLLDARQFQPAAPRCRRLRPMARSSPSAPRLQRRDHYRVECAPNPRRRRFRSSTSPLPSHCRGCRTSPLPNFPAIRQERRRVTSDFASTRMRSRLVLSIRSAVVVTMSGIVPPGRGQSASAEPR